jgi:hypothetical protein
MRIRPAEGPERGNDGVIGIPDPTPGGVARRDRYLRVASEPRIQRSPRVRQPARRWPISVQWQYSRSRPGSRSANLATAGIGSRGREKGSGCVPGCVGRCRRVGATHRRKSRPTVGLRRAKLGSTHPTWDLHHRAVVDRYAACVRVRTSRRVKHVIRAPRRGGA